MMSTVAKSLTSVPKGSSSKGLGKEHVMLPDYGTEKSQFANVSIKHVVVTVSAFFTIFVLELRNFLHVRDLEYIYDYYIVYYVIYLIAV